jgi:adenosylcobinamide-phosphate synthase
VTAALTLLALLLDAVFGEPRRWHPLVGFGRWAQYLERRLNGRGGNCAQRLLGLMAALLAVAPAGLLVAALQQTPVLRDLVDVLILYLAVGHRSLREHALRVYDALQKGDLPAARKCVGLMVSRDTAGMSAESVALATVESVLENGNDAVFGAVFWFVLAGAPGVLLYRLVNTLDAMWGYRTPRFLHFGWAAARLDDVLNFVPARLTALSYALMGRTVGALRCWYSQARSWESPNAGPVMAAGAGALGLALGGGANYHGRWEERPALGFGSAPGARAILAALRLVSGALLVWVLVIIAVEVVAHG